MIPNIPIPLSPKEYRKFKNNSQVDTLGDDRCFDENDSSDTLRGCEIRDWKEGKTLFIKDPEKEMQKDDN